MPTSHSAPADPAEAGGRDAIALRYIAAIALLASAVWVLVAILAVLPPLLGGEPLDVIFLAAGGVTVSSADGIPPLVTESYRVMLHAGEVSAAAFGLLLAEAALASLVGAFVAAAIAFTLGKVARGDAFHRALPGLAVAVGFALSAGMLLAFGLGGLGRMMAADELNAALGSTELAVGFELDLVPVMVGFAVLGLAAVFRVGSRLQRETAGLV